VAGVLAGEPADPSRGYGRVEIGEDGLPVALIWGMVDDFLVHAPTKTKCYAAFSEFMDHTMRLGFICQKVKTSPPAQVQKFCGMLCDTTKHPCIRIPDAKVSRSLATIEYVERQNLQGRLSRLTVSVLSGLLQSLVDGTPQRQGQTYVRDVYHELHGLTDLYGKALFYTQVRLSQHVIDDLGWWKELLLVNPGNKSRTATFGTLVVTWGDGSGTGTGGTLERVKIGKTDPLPTVETWMGAWSPQVFHFDSNWKELRTILWTLEQRCYRRPDRHIYWGTTLFYFTDNQVSYFVVQGGSSSSPELHKLVREIKILEVKLGCRLKALHVPGDLMILVGPDDLSRGMWMSPERHTVSSILASQRVLEAVPYTHSLGEWALQQAGLEGTPFLPMTSLDDWTFANIHHRLTIWTPAPEVARQALRCFLDAWVESPLHTAGLFMIPRVLQKDWGFISKHICETIVIYPRELPVHLRYDSLIALVLLYVPFYVRSLPIVRMDELTDRTFYEHWHQEQAEHVRGLS
jgi:hypothetical protein